MKSGRSIQDVSREILRQQEAKADYYKISEMAAGCKMKMHFVI